MGISRKSPSARIKNGESWQKREPSPRTNLRQIVHSFVCMHRNRKCRNTRTSGLRPCRPRPSAAENLDLVDPRDMRQDMLVAPSSLGPVHGLVGGLHQRIGRVLALAQG